MTNGKEEQNKKVNEMITRLKILPAWFCQSHMTK